MNKTEKRNLLSLAASDKHDDFIDAYGKLTDLDQNDPDLMMAYGDSLYELARDAECIDVYLEFALRHPKKRGKDFALFGAAMACKNIGLEGEALFLLERIKPNHSKRNEEILDSQQKIDVQNRSLKSLTNFKTNRDSKIAKVGG